jgi:hypothetical protein
MIKWLIDWFGQSSTMHKEEEQCQTCPNILNGREGEVKCSDSEGKVTTLKICSECADALEQRFMRRDKGQ